MVKNWLGRVFSFLSLIILTNWLICISNLLLDWVKVFWDLIMASILFSKSIDSLFCCDGTWKDAYETWFWEFYEICELIIFCICIWNSTRLQYSFLTRIYLPLVDIEKKDMKKNFRKIVEKVFKEVTLGVHIPTDSMKSWDDFFNYDYNYGDRGFIESDKIRHILLGHVVQSQIGDI